MAETVDDKLAYFQAVTGISDPDLCTEILVANNWDLQLAVSSITGDPSSPEPSTSAPPPPPPLDCCAAASGRNPAPVGSPPLHRHGRLLVELAHAFPLSPRRCSTR